MKVGMSTSCFFSREKLEDTVKIMEKIGVNCAEVFLNTLSEYEEDYCKDLRSRLDDSGIEVLSVHPAGIQFEMQMYTPYERTVRDCEEIFKRVLNAANILGAKRYIYHGGLNLKQRKHAFNIEKIADVTGKCAAAAKQYGIEFAYENVHWCWFNRPEFATELLKRCDNENLCFNLDIKQAAQSGYPYDEYMKTMGKRLKSVHLCDHKIGKEGEIIPVAPFCGITDFAKLREKLEASRYEGPCILELYANNYRDYGELKDIFDRLKQTFY